MERLVAVVAALVIFGIGYNALVDRLEREVPDHGYASFLVAGGVLATLAGAAFLIGLADVLLVGLCFAASGAPMIAGSVSRWLRRQARERTLMRISAAEALRGEEA